MTRIEGFQNRFHYLLAPFGAAYGLVMRLRRTCYGSGLLPSWAPPAITVSVGNIGWGGTGKTPLSGWFLGWAERQGLDSVLLTRGYKARPKQYPYLVNGKSLAEEAGDEPLLLAREHPKAHVVVDPVRRRSGPIAYERFSPHLIVLDDGFQHMAVQRDLNLVLFRPEDFEKGWNRVIPSGTWRESESALAGADAFFLKCPPDTFKAMAPLIRKRLGKFEKPVFSFHLRPSALRRINGKDRTDNFTGGPYALVSGVGDPDQVERTTHDFLGYAPAMRFDFPDHHFYTKTDALEIEAKAAEKGCEHILCTPKDAVKLGPLASDIFWTLDLKVVFGPKALSSETFKAWWADNWGRLSQEKGLRPAMPEADDVVYSEANELGEPAGTYG